MNVRTLCLSILFECDATGYEIRRSSVEGECSYFVEASYGSIYPALGRLEAEGLVSSRIEPQDGKPARKVYSITDAGRREFVEALKEPLAEDMFRSPFLLFARFVHLLPPELVEARLNEQLERLREKLKAIEEIGTEPDLGPADRWIIEYGKAQMHLAQTYVETHMHELVALSRRQSTPAAAE
jgi:PadR family transcriptional regulator AphA